MSIDIEQLIVALVFLVPGFISTAAEKTFQPRRFESAYACTISSLLRSIGLNFLGIVIVLILGRNCLISSEIFTSNIETFNKAIGHLPMETVIFYIIGLYMFSAIWGSAIGICPQLTLRAQANRLRLTTHGLHDSVWRRIKAVQRPSVKHFTWLKIHTDKGKILFGRLRHASSLIEQDKPVELFLNPVYEIREGNLNQFNCMGEQADGIYVRLGIADIVEFYFTIEETPAAFMPHIDDSARSDKIS